MIILGIDPGTATTGYALLKKTGDGVFNVLDFGVIKTSPKQQDSIRLLENQKDLQKIIKKFKPDVAGVEKLYFEKNAKTVMAVSQARGVVLVTLEKNNIKVHEFTPLQVKSIICGYGRADKKQVQYMVKKTLGLRHTPKPDDAADALAIALCAGLRK